MGLIGLTDQVGQTRDRPARALAMLLAVALSSGLAPALAAEPTPSAQTVARRFTDALGAARSPSPTTAVLGLWRAEELATLVPDGLTRIGELVDPTGPLARHRLGWVRAEAALVRGWWSVARGEPDAAPFLAAGVPSGGLVLGPLAGVAVDQPTPALPAAGKHGPTAWRAFTTGALPDVPLEDYMPSSGDAHVRVGFAFDGGGPARVILGTNGPFSATLDGRPLAAFEGERELADWQHDLPLTLAPGRHWLEIAVGHRTVAPELRVRVLLDDRAPPAWVALTAPPSTTAGWTSAQRPSLLAPQTRLERAELALRTEATPPSERAAARAIAALIAAAPTSLAPSARAERAELDYLLGRAEATDPSRATAAFEAAADAGHPQALAALLDLAEAHQLPARADALARRLAALDPQHPAAIGHAILRRFELTDGAASLPLLPTTLPYNARLRALEATLAESAGDLRRAADAARVLADLQLGAAEPVQRAVQLYQRARANDAALATIARAQRSHPMSADLAMLAARTRSLDAHDLGPALAALDLGRAFHAQNPLYEELRGRLLLLAGERGKAIEAFDRALELAPQNRELADYRSSLVTERGLADRWAEPVDALLRRAAATPRQSEGAVTVFERNVTQVFNSGLASQFRQLALRIDEKSAAERYEDMVFAFTPGEDRLEIIEAEILRATPGGLQRIRPQLVGEQRSDGKSEGVYTLTAYKVVRFPALEVGDVVHVQSRKDEIGSRNLFGDFFGVFLPMSTELPKVHAEAIVVAPAARPLYFHAARLPPPTEVVADGMRTLTFAVDELPALTIEPAMPGYGDVAAWISVSTFESWQALATWYRELVRPQLETPPALVDLARSLTRDAPDLEARVQAIHRWVVGNTRYVGIEFGIHGFKPYKVAEVVQRGYGDCKDKASLLVAMLRAAGVPAEFVLVRTRDLGAIDGTPATLWAFNHAIAYVPGLDLYLDGTAESSGLRELPELDQDAQVLRLDLFSDAPPTLARIPLQSGADNRVVAEARYVLDADGDATSDLSETVRGTSAGRLRARLQDPTRRDAIIADIIASQHPGTSLESASYENLDALGQPVTIRAKIRLPKLAVKDGATLDLPLVLEPGARLLQMAPLAVRKQPLVLTVTELEDNTDVYVLPEGAAPAALPAPIEVASPFGRWTMALRMDGRDVVATSRWELTKTRIEPADYPAFRRFLEDVSRTEALRLRIHLPR